MKTQLKLLYTFILLPLAFFNPPVLATEAVNDVDVAAQSESKAKPEATAAEQSWKPTATEFDWVQLTSGEWLKGEIKSMYNEVLEFDSDKLDLLTIDMEDVRYLQSFNPISINIENLGSVRGVLNISEDEISINNENNVQKFKAIELISFAPGGEREFDFWWLRFTLGFDVREGNTNQIDFSSKLSAKRRTASSNFAVDYIGNLSKTDAVSGELEETINSHRINFNLDRFVTRYFFYTPIFGEYFSDPFQNIDKRYSLGVGIGYTLTRTDEIEWSISGGPSYLSTKYISVPSDADRVVDTASLSLSTDYEFEISNKIDFIFKYRIQLSGEDSGGYTHHVIATLENEITTDFDLDISMIWDRISEPTIDEDQNVPEKNDIRLVLGITYTY